MKIKYVDRYGRGLKEKKYKLTVHFKGEKRKLTFYIEGYTIEQAREKFKKQKPYLIIDKIRVAKK